jgi:Cobalamin synthesis protein cobW C-terminal domain
MLLPNITVVAGLAGAGKTTWICQEIANKIATPNFPPNVLYFSPGTGNLPIDQTCLSAEFPQVQVFFDGQEVEFIKQLALSDLAYIEIGFYLDLSSISKLLGDKSYNRVAIVSENSNDSEYHSWAQKIISGALIQDNFTKNHLTQNQLWRAPISGQVIDEESLREFWYEITNGAYGNITRCKGVFDVADGRSLYADFVAGVPSPEFIELNLPRNLEGRPERFSGMEVLGENLDAVVIKQTLEDCCLSDAAILQAQEQVKEALLDEGGGE